MLASISWSTYGVYMVTALFLYYGITFPVLYRPEIIGRWRRWHAPQDPSMETPVPASNVQENQVL